MSFPLVPKLGYLCFVRPAVVLSLSTHADPGPGRTRAAFHLGGLSSVRRCKDPTAPNDATVQRSSDATAQPFSPAATTDAAARNSLRSRADESPD
ncbi:MAG: hypothetical protein V3V08_14290 [Nannocystaceae bacterium]